jgi:hypothetical protein
MQATCRTSTVREMRGSKTRAAWQDPEKAERMRARGHLVHLTPRQRLTYDLCRDMGVSIEGALNAAAFAPAV